MGLDSNACRQRRWQDKQQALGLCRLCGNPICVYETRAGVIKRSPLCASHLEKSRLHARVKLGLVRQWTPKCIVEQANDGS